VVLLIFRNDFRTEGDKVLTLKSRAALPVNVICPEAVDVKSDNTTAVATTRATQTWCATAILFLLWTITTIPHHSKNRRDNKQRDENDWAVQLSSRTQSLPIN
jgi:hypothetical protein